MLARVLRLPFACGFLLTLLVSVVLLLLLGPTTGWAQGPEKSNALPPGQSAGIPLTGGDDPLKRGPIVPPQYTPRSNTERPVGFLPSTQIGSDDPLHRSRMEPPAITAGGNEAVNGSEGASTESGRVDSPAVQGLNAPEATYISPLLVPAADFRNDGGATGGYFFPFSGGYFYPTGATVCMMAPAYLPQNATAFQMSVSVYDNGGATRPWLNLYRVDNFAGTVVTMGGIATTATSTSIQGISDSSIINPLVVYPTYSYYVAGCLYNTAQRIYSVRLYYTGP